MADKFKSKDLLFNHYSDTVTSGDNPDLRSKVLFNRKEKYEVVTMINNVMDELKLTSVASGQKIEKKIADELPSDTRGRENVTNWLVNNWK